MQDEPLQCLTQSKRADWGAGYETFAQNFVRFEELGCSPLKTNLPVDKLRLEQLLKENEAKWHKACKDAFNYTKLQRAKKRKYKELAASNQTSPVKRRGVSLSAATTNSQPKCFFCDETSGELHKASTFSLDELLRKCAVLLQDNKLIAKLSCGDLIEGKFQALHQQPYQDSNMVFLLWITIIMPAGSLFISVIWLPCPAVAHEFKNGHFVIKKTVRAFSKIPLDHAHEQNNKSVKGRNGVAIGLTENPAELRWMVSGPELSRMINEFETSQNFVSVAEDSADKNHHEDSPAVQRKFIKDVR